jgi:hypothetical protein
MKTENEIKTALLNEVIERIEKGKIDSPATDNYQYYNAGIDYSIIIIKSLLPKEEPEKGKPLTENKTKGNLKPETPNERQCPPPAPPPIRVLREGEKPREVIRKPEPTQEIKAEMEFKEMWHVQLGIKVKLVCILGDLLLVN